MRFFDFLESKYTRHSITNQAEHFSALADGEQKATQSFLWALRLICKFFAMIKLPLEFLACKVGLIEFPEPAKEIMERAVKDGKERAEKMKAQAKGPARVVNLDSRPQELQ
jgi:hypothetical protein